MIQIYIDKIVLHRQCLILKSESCFNYVKWSEVAGPLGTYAQRSNPSFIESTQNGPLPWGVTVLSRPKLIGDVDLSTP